MKSTFRISDKYFEDYNVSNNKGYIPVMFNAIKRYTNKRLSIVESYQQYSFRQTNISPRLFNKYFFEVILYFLTSTNSPKMFEKLEEVFKDAY